MPASGGFCAAQRPRRMELLVPDDRLCGVATIFAKINIASRQRTIRRAFVRSIIARGITPRERNNRVCTVPHPCRIALCATKLREDSTALRQPTTDQNSSKLSHTLSLSLFTTENTECDQPWPDTNKRWSMSLTQHRNSTAISGERIFRHSHSTYLYDLKTDLCSCAASRRSSLMMIDAFVGCTRYTAIGC
jgi:hypothetical protein